MRRTRARQRNRPSRCDNIPPGELRFLAGEFYPRFAYRPIFLSREGYASKAFPTLDEVRVPGNALCIVTAAVDVTTGEIIARYIIWSTGHGWFSGMLRNAP